MYRLNRVVISFRDSDVVVAHPCAEQRPSGISLLCQYVDVWLSGGVGFGVLCGGVGLSV